MFIFHTIHFGDNSERMASEPFVTQFQGKTELTSCDFLKIFREFDKDGRVLTWQVFFLSVKCAQFLTALSSACDIISPVENTVCFFLLSSIVSGFYSGNLAILIITVIIF